jgi:general secretion pathway protein C
MAALSWVGDLRNADALRERLDRDGPRVVTVVLAALIVWQLAAFITRQPAAPAKIDPAQMAVRPANPLVEISSIVNAHLFGQVAAPAASAADAPQTTMPLVLAGVLAVSDPKKGMAIVGPNASSAKLVQVDGNIEGGARLNAVYNDRVLLDRGGGVIEALYLPKTAGTAMVAPLPPPASTGGQRLQNLSQNGTLLNGLARVQAVFSGGKLSGYRIFPGGRNSLNAFNQLGLRAGDLITAVNGTALDDPNRATEVMQTLSNAGSATVTVNRNGQPQEVNLNLESVASAAEEAVAADAAATGTNGPGGNPPALGARLGGPAGAGGPGGPGGRAGRMGSGRNGGNNTTENAPRSATEQ